MIREPTAGRDNNFLSTLSLRRATWADTDYNLSDIFSIHALLAESDNLSMLCSAVKSFFYPRSPCGERLGRAFWPGLSFYFLSTLSLRRATQNWQKPHGQKNFLSTLSLRRATIHAVQIVIVVMFFYPRSPCGERPAIDVFLAVWAVFLSTLSLRRATVRKGTAGRINSIFYPRSPCGERHLNLPSRPIDKKFSIHALLAESDSREASVPIGTLLFYPRSPCGERLKIGKNLTDRKIFYPRSPCGERL